MYINNICVQKNSTDGNWWIGRLTSNYDFIPLKGGYHSKLSAHKVAEKMIDKERENNKNKFF